MAMAGSGTHIFKTLETLSLVLGRKAVSETGQGIAGGTSRLAQKV
jgi:hypothetical protein